MSQVRKRSHHRADLGGGCRGCAPPPSEMTCGFLIQLVSCKQIFAPKHTKTTFIWPEPQILEAFGTKVRLVNTSQEPKIIGRHERVGMNVREVYINKSFI